MIKHILHKKNQNDDSKTYDLLLLHGYGADGDDLLPLGDLMHREFDNLNVILLEAPFPCGMMSELENLGEEYQSEIEDKHYFANPPMHFGGREWFSLSTLSEHECIEGAKKALPYLKKYIDDVKKQTKTAKENTILMGFSQGAMMSLTALIMLEYDIKGLIGFSGFLPMEIDDLVKDNENLKARLKNTPIFLYHGYDDNVVPHIMMEKTNIKLEPYCENLEIYSEHGLAHGISQNGFEKAKQFLGKLIA